MLWGQKLLNSIVLTLEEYSADPTQMWHSNDNMASYLGLYCTCAQCIYFRHWERNWVKLLLT